MIWVPVELCRNKTKILKNALQSYPSGHTATIFTVMVFLSLYLNAKFKAFADFNTGFWKMLFVIAPVMAAVFASGTLFIDGVSPIYHGLRVLSLATFRMPFHYFLFATS